VQTLAESVSLTAKKLSLLSGHLWSDSDEVSLLVSLPAADSQNILRTDAKLTTTADLEQKQNKQQSI